MDDRYEAFCLASPTFYDVLHGENRSAPYPLADEPLPPGWRRRAQDDWLVFSPPDADGQDNGRPVQGWKIHISACLDNAERVLATVRDYCLARGIEFKVLRSPAALLARVSKYAPRGYSGKLVTIYPADDAQCETILTELGDALDGEPNPYILSDLRWRNGPLFVRYGAFASRHCVGPNGQIVPAIADDTGQLVPDRRGPVFYVPPWVTLPDFLAPHLDARNAVTVSDMPYAIERVLHFSNGGGIYEGRDTRTDARVVLKEGRPYGRTPAWTPGATTRCGGSSGSLRCCAGSPASPAFPRRTTCSGSASTGSSRWSISTGGRSAGRSRSGTR